MSRPQKKRSVSTPPLFHSFKPTGVRRGDITQISLTLDEYEAVRLADYSGLEHEGAAAEMGISRPTFTRLLEKARAKISVFIVEGKELRIEGGSVHFKGNLFRCLDCGGLFGSGFEKPGAACPFCGSGKVKDLAGGFGHGRCCGKYYRAGGDRD